LVRDVTVAAALAFAVMLGLPRLIPLLPYDAQLTLYEMGQSVGLYPQTQAARAAASAVPGETTHAQMTAVLLHGANVRSEPSSKGSVVSSLTRGAGVVPLEMKGNWTRVRLEDASEGWVFSAYLKQNKPKR
jgi:SH3-like domain-containing protein